MPRFFITEKNLNEYKNDLIVLYDEDAMHISKSLRMKPNEKVVVCDFYNYEYDCVIEKITANEVFLKVISKTQSKVENKIFTHLFQAVLKGEKTDLVIQKTVELGVSKITLFISENCVSRPDEKSVDKKLDRWKKIAEEAAKQCGRAKIPEICGIVKYEDVLQEIKQYDSAFLCYECEKEFSLYSELSSKSLKTLGFIIGPEGGFSSNEAKIANEFKINSVTLGKRILRAETAPIYVMSCISFYEEI